MKPHCLAPDGLPSKMENGRNTTFFARFGKNQMKFILVALRIYRESFNNRRDSSFRRFAIGC